jgi:hypothetical protein
VVDVGGHISDVSGGDSAAVGLQLAFAHDGRDFLHYECRTWRVPPVGSEDEPEAAQRETGFWRRGFNQDAVEVVLADSGGAITAMTGIAGDARWELATDSAAATPTGRTVRAERRLYAVVRDALMVVAEQKVDDRWLPHMNAQLFRVR